MPILRHIVVCMKQVPDVNEMRLDPETHRVIRGSTGSMVNPDDEYALEAALNCKDRWDVKVTALTMGPESAEQILRYALRQGADSTLHLVDKAFAGADTLATSRVLAWAVQYLGKTLPVGLVICGDKAIDGDTAQVGPGLAARLGYTLVRQVWTIEDIVPDESGLIIERRSQVKRQRLLVPLPSVITVTSGGYAIRYSALPHLIRAARASVPRMNANDLGLEPWQVGMAGSATRVSRVETAVFPTRDGLVIERNQCKVAVQLLRQWLRSEG